MQHGVYLEEQGGDTQAVNVSAGQGLKELQENIVALAELLDIRAETDGPAEGCIIESRVDRGRGNVSTVLVKRGTVRVGDVLVAGTTYAKVRSMVDDTGKSVKSAGPGMPVEVSGWKDLAMAGDEVLQSPGGEAMARQVVDNRKDRQRRLQDLKTLEEINKQRRLQKEGVAERKSTILSALQKGRANTMSHPTDNSSEVTPPISVPELRVIVKADVAGSLEAVMSALEGLPSNQARVHIIHSGVGPIVESDLHMASSSALPDAEHSTRTVIFGFNVKPADKRVISQAKLQNVAIVTFPVIYRLLDEAKKYLVELLPPTIEKRVGGEAQVLQLFDIKGKLGSISKIAGCRVTNGSIKRQDHVRVIRDGDTIYEGKMTSLKHVKKDVMEAGKGLECGICLEDASVDIRPGDIIQTFSLVQVAQTL